MKKLAIDLDGVVFNFVDSFISWLSKKYKKEIKYEQITDYYWYNCFEWLPKNEFWYEFHEFGTNSGYADLPFYLDAEKAMNHLVERCDVKIVTHRPLYSYRDTVKLLRYLFGIKQKDIHFAKGSKSDVINRLKADVFIDDASHNVLEAAKKTKSRVYIMDQPYNRDVKSPLIKRVKNWKEFIEMEGLLSAQVYN